MSNFRLVGSVWELNFDITEVRFVNVSGIKVSWNFKPVKTVRVSLYFFFDADLKKKMSRLKKKSKTARWKRITRHHYALVEKYFKTEDRPNQQRNLPQNQTPKQDEPFALDRYCSFRAPFIATASKQTRNKKYNKTASVLQTNASSVPNAIRLGVRFVGFYRICSRAPHFVGRPIAATFLRNEIRGARVRRRNRPRNFRIFAKTVRVPWSRSADPFCVFVFFFFLPNPRPVVRTAQTKVTAAFEMRSEFPRPAN